MQVKTTYEQAAARRFPEQVVIAIAKDAQGRYNPITLGWTMLASHQPPMMAIAVGKTRYSLDAIRQAKTFVLAYPSAANASGAWNRRRVDPGHGRLNRTIRQRNVRRDPCRSECEL